MSDKYSEFLQQRSKRARPGEFVKCSVEGCERKQYCRSMCGIHYNRVRHHGHPDVFHNLTVEERFWQKVDKSGNCWEWTSAFRRDGYGVLNIDNKAKPAHRLSWTFANGEIPEGKWVLHRCDNKKCVRPDHLFLGVSMDNVRDMVSKDRHSYGARQPKAKLTDSTVSEIKKSTDVHQKIGDRYGVCRQLVSSIKSGKKWAHVK